MTGPVYRRYVLGVATTVYGLNLVDRGVIQILLEPIKQDLSLSDTQLGFLTGIAFGLFYAIAGIPIARLADRGNRATITSVAIGLWALTVMSVVFVTNFLGLLAARVAAAVGEAGCKPPTYSLIGDYFPKPAERTRAMAIFWLGGPIASLVSYALGGWLSEIYGWRLTFFVMGLPGLLLALIVFTTIKDPRTARTVEDRSDPERPGMWAVFRHLWVSKSCRNILIGLTLLFTMCFGMNPWYASFLIRSHGMETSTIGVALGLIFSLGGVAGILLGGYIGSNRLADDERAQLRWSGLAIACVMPFFIGFLLLPTKLLALAALVPLQIVLNLFFAPTFALLQRLVPENMRATSLSIIMLFANLIGMGVGPQMVGILSDGLNPSFGVDSLRYAMLAMTIVALWSGYHFWAAGRSVRSDLVEVRG
ncbi:spinster family MFS transporter [Sphingosinicella rhizophila]|uniref:MFS transporter n=1 Tax=Sphingosinicella rhizophila TaxID=3050082 RepID=A0ABU3Q5U8_9SPHN|nr:MFS transporter [Sphingosinicella sp. GR2756]MDT9598348.1 MFS transporter [Sphingosinicella sp. GR2756]